jgi:hypothetical protein
VFEWTITLEHKDTASQYVNRPATTTNWCRARAVSKCAMRSVLLARKAGNLCDIHNYVQAQMQGIDRLRSILDPSSSVDNLRVVVGCVLQEILKEYPWMVYEVVFESTSIVTVLRRQVRIRRRTCEARMLIVHIAFGLQQRYIVECNNDTLLNATTIHC